MRKILLCLLALSITAFLTLGLFFGGYTRIPASGNGYVDVVIPKGAGVRQIGSILEEEGVVRSGDIRFVILAGFSGVSTRLRAGEYRIPLGLTPPEVLRLLEKGEVIQHPVTIPEGLTIVQIAEIFADKGWGKPEVFVELASNKEFVASTGINQNTLEGYLFPDTYFLTRGSVDEKYILRLMASRFFEVLERLPVEQLSGLSLHEMVTLASMVEKETGSAAERPLIAGVFFNRLERKMRLQSDPTVIYGIKDFDGNLTRADLRRPSPYNTYLIQGLPVGPICNPGREAMLAVLLPEHSDALYFVSRNDGTHVFSSSLKQHNRAVIKYQKNFKARN